MPPKIAPQNLRYREEKAKIITMGTGPNPAPAHSNQDELKNLQSAEQEDTHPPLPPDAASDLNWLFVDLNSYFASVEQQDRPDLRGQPIAVVPMMADTTCRIAASYEAKAHGVRTGTIVADAKRMCPGIVLVEGRHELYTDYHHRIVE